MKGTDKLLIGIVAGVVILVVVVFAIALLQPREPSYQPEDTPEGVAHNYLLALQLEDYGRAHGYLSPRLPGYPADAEELANHVDENRWRFSRLDDDISLAVESVKVTGDRAEVLIRETRFYEGGLFDSGQYSTTFEMTLRREDGAWRISESDRYWVSCWSKVSGCR